MDIFTQIITALVLGVVQGVTEFLPISSTGHLIVTSNLLGVSKETADIFNVVVQLPSIFAVCWVFRQKIAEVTVGVLCRPRSLPSMRFVLMLILAVLPAIVLGLIFHKQIKDYLFNAYVVAGALIVGGIIIIIVERYLRSHPQQMDIDDMTAGTAVKIGFAQAVAMIPGTSRSGATIIGGVIFGLSRKAATEFSFFLAIPTMFGATILEIYKSWGDLKLELFPFFAVGCVASFISAMWAVRFLLRYISTHTFIPFAYYRIGFGLIVLATGFFNLIDWAAWK